MAVPQPAPCPGDSVHLEDLPARRDLPRPIGTAVRPPRHVGDVRRRRGAHRPDGVHRGGRQPGRARHAVRRRSSSSSFTTVFTDDVATLGVPERSGARGCGRRRRTRRRRRADVELDPDVPEVLDDAGCVRLDGDIVSGPSDEARVSRSGFGAASSASASRRRSRCAGTGDDSAAVTSRGHDRQPVRGADRRGARATRRRSRWSSDHGRPCSSSTAEIVGAVEIDGRDAVIGGGVERWHPSRAPRPLGAARRSGC